MEYETRDKPYKIIVPVANPVNQRKILRIAAASASAYENAEIIAINVIILPDQTALAQGVEYEQERVERHQNLLDEVEKAAQDFDIGIRSRVVIGRNVKDVVLNLVRKELADELILGWKGIRKKREFILGSIIDPIVKKAPCKVTLVKQKEEKIGNVATFVGTGPHTVAAVKRAYDIVKNVDGASLTLINIQETNSKSTDDELKKKGELLINKTLYDAGIDDDKVKKNIILSDNIEKDMISAASKFDTSCIGATRSSRLESALFGSFPELIGEKVDSSVLIIRGEERTFYSVWHIFKRLFSRSKTSI